MGEETNEAASRMDDTMGTRKGTEMVETWYGPPLDRATTGRQFGSFDCSMASFPTHHEAGHWLREGALGSRWIVPKCALEGLTTSGPAQIAKQAKVEDLRRGNVHHAPVVSQIADRIIPPAGRW